MERDLYLKFVQSAINQYSWKSLVIKMVSVAFFVLALLVIYGGGQSPREMRPVLLGGVILGFFVMWLLDGHYAHMQQSYIDLYSQAASADSATFRMEIDPPKGLNVQGLWKPAVLLAHVPSIAFMSFLSLFNSL